jgi:DNA-binding NtrC family response regulator
MLFEKAADPRMRMELDGLKVLVVEDEMLVAAEMEATLEDLGCHVVGPFGRVGQALAALDDVEVDAAVLDVNVRGEMIFPVAERLQALGVPMIFCTGYADLPNLPEPLKNQVRLSKPCAAASIEQALRAQVISGARQH